MSDHTAAYIWKQQMLHELRNFTMLLESEDYRKLLEDLKIEIDAILNTRYLLKEMYDEEEKRK